MKKIFFLLILVTLFFSVQQTYAASKSSVSLSDAIIADLALRNYLDYVSIYFEDKKTPATISLNPNKQWIPASTVKLYVAMYAFDQIAKKTISPDDTVTIDEKNVVPTELETDEFPVLTPGFTTTVDTLLQKMITQSDNIAYNTLLDVLDRQKITAYIQNIGLTHTVIGSKLNLDDDQTQHEFTTPGFNINTTTAQDFAKAYDLLDRNKVPLSKSLLHILAHQKINSMLPAFLPKSLTIEHKTGDLDPLYHDGGIVVGNNHHYILTIFSNLGNPNILAHISELVYTRNYALVGSVIPQKDDTSKPNGLQALDPLLLNKTNKNVLGATTPISIPLPDITAHDVGISNEDISLVIPFQELPQPFLPPFFNNIWFGLQKSVVLGEKARQHVALSYAESELGRAYTLSKQGNSQGAMDILTNISETLKQVAKDPTLSPDQLTQLIIKSLSDTQFSLMNKQLQATQNDTTRAELIHTIAQTARLQLSEIEPHLAEAKAATSLSQKPLVGKVIDVSEENIVMQTSGGQQLRVPINQNTKVKNNSLANKKLAFEKGVNIAVIGNVKGQSILPSLIINNIPAEIAAPHPVTIEKVNQKNKTIVVSDNGNLIQVNLTPQTTIKAKDTNLQISSLKQGNIVVVHGNIFESTSSHSQESPTPTQKPDEKNNPAVSPKESQNSAANPVSVIPSLSATPTLAPSAVIQQNNASHDSAPEVIRATSIQVIQQQNTKASTPQSQPAKQADTRANNPPQTKSQSQATQAPQSPSSQNGKGNGK